MNKLHQAALANTELLEDEQAHFWMFDYGLNHRDLSKSLHKLKAVLKGVLAAHSCKKKFNIKFEEMQGLLGYTDMKNVVLNVGMFTRVEKAHVVPVFSAIALHEYFHILYTNNNSKYLKLDQSSPYWLLGQFVEDTRIETVGKSNNFSCWESFSILMRDVLETSFKSFDITSGEALLNSAMKVVYKWVRCPRMLTLEEAAFEIAPGLKLLEELEKVVPDYGPLDAEFSTDAVVDAIKELLDKYQEKSSEQSGEEQTEEGEQNEQPDTQAAGGSPEGDLGVGEGAPDINNTEEAENTEEHGDDAQPDQSAKVSPTNSPKFDQKQFQQVMEDFNKAITGKPDKSGKEAKLVKLLVKLDENPVGLDNSIQQKGSLYVSLNELPGSAEPPTVINCRPVQALAHSAIKVFDRDYQAVRGGIKALKSKFLIRHSERQVDIKEQTSGYLDRTKLFKAGFDSHIFKTHETVKSVGMDIALLLDMSGSMSYQQRMMQCRRSGILLGKACEGIPGLDLSIYAHTTGNDESGIGYGNTCEIMSLYGDLAPKDVRNLGMIQPTGGTFDGFAIDFTGRRLLNRINGNEKWLIYVADGEPCACKYGGGEAIEHTGKVVRRLMRKGLHIIGVDIGDMSHFKQMFPVSVAFTDIGALVSNLGRLVGTLVRTRSKEIHV